MERSATDRELGQFIPLHYHFSMLDDVARTGAFEEAIARAVLAILPAERRSVDWLMNYLIVPLPTAIDASPGNTVEIAFDYAFGGPLNSLTPRARLVAM